MLPRGGAVDHRARGIEPVHHLLWFVFGVLLALGTPQRERMYLSSSRRLHMVPQFIFALQRVKSD